jgi:BA14K-like protein
MKFPLVLAGVVAGLGAALLLTATAARAQTTGSINPSADRTDTSAKDEPPSGGCMPIGVTASGEVVFPFLCKGFIEQHKVANQKPAAADDVAGGPAAADGPPKSEDKRAAIQPEEVAPKAAAPAPEVAKEGQGPSPTSAATDERRPAGDDKPEHADETRAAKPADTAAAAASPTPEPAGPAPSPQPSKPREGRAGPPGCTRFRSYDASSGTYRDFSGRRQACRS